MIFFQGTRYAGQVFRYVIYNREGYSQLVSEGDKVALVDLSEYDPDAALAATTGQPIVNVQEAPSPDSPSIFARAYVPAIANNKVVAVVTAYVDETEQRAVFRKTSLLSATAVWIMAGLSFGIPAIAWYYRTKEKQRADRRIRFLAHHDSLTGLANRTRLIERLDTALAVLPSVDGAVAVHFIDIDHFKEVNDSLGHDGGDFLLSTVGQRLNALTRVEDFVARLGGDEFVVLQTGVGSKEHADTFAKRISTVLREPMYFREEEIKTNVTIGVAIAPADGKTSERLLKSADLALYEGKAAGRNCIRFFTPEMDDALRARMKLERRIRDAVENNGFVLHYQPVFEINGRRLVGFEALLRLPDHDGTLIPPASFIPIAEEMRVIDKIGAWVLREACRNAKGWPRNLTVAVNLSPSQFEIGNITEIVAAALKESGLEPQRLELEITETLLLGNNEKTMAQLHAVKDMGVLVVMDDFGTGYSSLSYLWKFPFDKIKIDRSFMEGFAHSGRDVETVVKTIIALGRELNMRVTVEGVETLNQVNFLYDAEADQVQGFYFGKPVPASEVSADILAEFHKTLPAHSTATEQPDKPQVAAKSSRS
jgi:diguanylate cyclase (GGDEF)-like protein